MGFSWGAAASQFGKDLPGVGAAIDNIDVQKRKKKNDEQQAILDSLTADTNKIELNKMVDAITKQEEGRADLSKYLSANDKYNEAQLQRMPEQGSSFVGAPTKAMVAGKNINDLLDKMEKPEISPKMVSASAYDPGLKAMVDYELANKRIDNKGKTGGVAFNRVGARKDFNTPENIAATNAFILDNKDNLGIDDAYANELMRQVDTGYAYDVNEITRAIAEKKLGIQPEVDKKWALVAPSAATTSATTSAEVATKKDEQIKKPVFSDSQSGAISDAYSAVQYLNTLKKAVESGNLGYFDIDKKTGQFVNPHAADAFTQLVEIVGRKRSGAAIADSEWKNFGKEILNKNNLLSDAGRQQAVNSLDHYLTKFYGAGANVAGDDNWYKNYDARATKARTNAEGAPEVSKATIQYVRDPKTGKLVRK